MIPRFGSVVWITSLIAACIAIVIATAIPAGYFAISYQYMIGSIDTQAELAARTTETLVMANPNTWQFEEIRLQELLQRYHDKHIPELREVVDRHGNLVARMTDSPLKPLVMRRCDIYDAGDIVGHVEISRSLRPLLIRTALIGALSFLLGGCIFLVLRIIPLSAVRAEQLRAQQLEIQNRQLQKAESLGLMAGAIAHHFNNQLHAVMGNLELAIMDLPPESDAAESLTEAMSASRRAAEVSSLMLTYLGLTSVESELLDLSETCHLCLSMLRAVIPDKVIVESEFPLPGPTIRANTVQVSQVLSNLVNNGLESIGDHCGTLKLTVKTVSPAEIPASYRFPVDWQPQSISYACLQVADTGCGIAVGDIEKIFDPFFTTKSTGRGLGLPVILGIVRAYDGVISVESEPGRGSSFGVYFAVSAEEIPPKRERTDAAPKFDGDGTVPPKEDDKMVRKMA